MTEPEPLRDRLLRLRANALAQLSEGDGIDSGLLQIIAHVTATLHVLDEAAAADRAAAVSR